MTHYGLPYQGSKSKIAMWVLRNLPTANTLVDLFAGGCNPIHMCDAIVHKAGGNGMEIKFKPSRKMLRILGVPIYPKLTTK